MRPVLFTLLLGTASAAAACFNAPAEQVQFSCEPDGADACPPDYECRADGCCHRSDTPDDAAEGACKLGGGGATAGTTTGTGTSGTTAGPATSTDATSATSAGTTGSSGTSSTTTSSSTSTGSTGSSTTGASTT